MILGNFGSFLGHFRWFWVILGYFWIWPFSIKSKDELRRIFMIWTLTTPLLSVKIPDETVKKHWNWRFSRFSAVPWADFFTFSHWGFFESAYFGVFGVFGCFLNGFECFWMFFVFFYRKKGVLSFFKAF